MVGSAIVRRLEKEDCHVVVPAVRHDLREQEVVRELFAQLSPEVVILAAAKVGGIVANDMYPAQFIYDNLMIEANVIEAARQAGVSKLLFLGSSCIYPKLAPQPIPEDALLTGALEPTNQWYAVAKIAGVMMCKAYRREYSCDFISAMPTNLYGPGDNFDALTSHVLPALIKKAHDAKEQNASHITIWGTGEPRREFLHVDDLADACIYLLRSYSSDEILNVGWGKDISILELAHLICNVVGFEGRVVTDPAKPDGTPRKLLDCDRLKNLGWVPRVGLAEGIADTYRSYLSGP